MPAEIENKYPNFWTKESEEGSKNKFESDLLAAQLRRHNIGVKYNYHKIIKAQEAKQIERDIRYKPHVHGHHTKQRWGGLQDEYLK